MGLTGRKFSEEHKRKISEALKGKGHPQTEETRRKISKSMKGIVHSESARKKMSKAMKGRKLPIEQIQRLSKLHKGKKHSEEHNRKISEALKGRESPMKGKAAWNKGVKRCFSEDTIKKLSDSLKGRRAWNKGLVGAQKGYWSGKERLDMMKENNPNWNGGISFEPYCPKFNERLKERIRERDNRTCQLCGIKENGRKHDVHHVHYDKQNCAPDLITLCIRCHSRVNCNRDYYESLFMQKLKERGLLIEAPAKN